MPRIKNGTVLSVKKTNERIVLKDIETQSGNFIVNGIVVSNSHHAAASTFCAVIQRIRSMHKFGITATPYRTDGLQKIFIDHLGGLGAIMKVEALRPDIHFWDYCPPIDLSDGVSYNGKFNLSKLTKILGEDPMYNALIMDLVRRCVLAEGRRTLIIANSIPWCNRLVAMIQNELNIYDVMTAHSKKSKKHNEAALKARVLVGTPKMFGEYIDIPDLEALINGTPFGTGIRFPGDEIKNGLIEQMIGRLQRYHPTKQKPVMHDVTLPKSANSMIHSLGEQRKRYYKMENYAIIKERFDP